MMSAKQHGEALDAPLMRQATSNVGSSASGFSDSMRTSQVDDRHSVQAGAPNDQCADARPEEKALNLWHIWLPLSYEVLIGYSTTLSGAPLARTLELMTADATAYQSGFNAISSCSALCAPLVGWSIDAYGTAKWHKLIASFALTTGGVLICIGVRMPLASGLSLPLYLSGMVLIALSMFAVMGVVFGNLVASYCRRRPDKAAFVSAAPSILLLVGMSAGSPLLILFPIGPDDPHYCARWAPTAHPIPPQHDCAP
jgi:hypothetical protein